MTGFSSTFAAHAEATNAIFEAAVHLGVDISGDEDWDDKKLGEETQKLIAWMNEAHEELTKCAEFIEQADVLMDNAASTISAQTNRILELEKALEDALERRTP